MIARLRGSKMNRIRTSLRPDDPGRNSFMFLYREPTIESTSGRPNAGPTLARIRKCGDNLIVGVVVDALEPTVDQLDIPITPFPAYKGKGMTGVSPSVGTSHIIVIRHHSSRRSQQTRRHL